MRRIALAFVLLACASPAFAAQDRYGPPQAEAASNARPARLPAGPFLDWTGKAAGPQADSGPPAADRSAPIAPWAQRLAPAQGQTVAIPQPQARVLPTSVNAPQPFAPRAPSAPPPIARATVAPPPIATAEAPGASERPRFYSVARQYGAQPDPIPVAATPRGQAVTLSEIPSSENLGRSQAPLDDGRATQAVSIPDTKQNAASNRISRYGL